VQGERVHVRGFRFGRDFSDGRQQALRVRLQELPGVDVHGTGCDRVADQLQLRLYRRHGHRGTFGERNARGHLSGPEHRVRVRVQRPLQQEDETHEVHADAERQGIPQGVGGGLWVVRLRHLRTLPPGSCATHRRKSRSPYLPTAERYYVRDTALTKLRSVEVTARNILNAKQMSSVDCGVYIYSYGNVEMTKTRRFSRD